MKIKVSDLKKVRIGVIGCGNMGKSMMVGLVQKKIVNPKSLITFDVDKKRISSLKRSLGVTTVSSASDVAEKADWIVLAVKPNQIPEVLDSIESVLNSKKVILSIAAGISIKLIEKQIKKSISIIRVMPNLPAQIGYGISAFSCNRRTPKSKKKIAETILGSFGETVEVQEKAMDVVTAVSGSGPAYYFLFSQLLVEVAQRLGLSKSVAKKLVYSTAYGSSRMIQSLDDGIDLNDLVSKVASKGGTTEAALKAFKKTQLNRSVYAAVKAADKRSKELRCLF